MTALRLTGMTDTGLVRTENEDLFLLGRFIKNAGAMEMAFSGDDDFIHRYGFLAAVADGLGGHAAGALAARLALRSLEQQFYGAEKHGQWRAALDALRQGCDRANSTVLQVSLNSREHEGMGCVLAGFCLMDGEYVVFHAGDSRVYRWRYGALRQLTEDDTLVGMAVREGHMTPEEAQASESRHIITNGVGTSNYVLRMTEPTPLHGGDRLLVCSDGLHDMLPFERIEELLGADIPNADKARTLVGEAKAAGGHDNITVLLLEAENGNGDGG